VGRGGSRENATEEKGTTEEKPKDNMQRGGELPNATQRRKPAQTLTSRLRRTEGGLWHKERKKYNSRKTGILGNVGYRGG